eukprot:Hpha_TRINITY_DN13727_c0_g1::TRINITY_DN13727_c0_g1_i1::g.142464::m.142464
MQRCRFSVCPFRWWGPRGLVKPGSQVPEESSFTFTSQCQAIAGGLWRSRPGARIRGVLRHHFIVHLFEIAYLHHLCLGLRFHDYSRHDEPDEEETAHHDQCNSGGAHTTVVLLTRRSFVHWRRVH